MTVLVITVEASRWGDPIFTLEKEFENYRNGDVFVRRPGKTERANAADIRALTARARELATLQDVVFLVPARMPGSAAP